VRGSPTAFSNYFKHWLEVCRTSSWTELNARNAIRRRRRGTFALQAP